MKKNHAKTKSPKAKMRETVGERTRLMDCRIISHRGEHDNRNVFENTLKSFDKALESGIFGIEFDLRWTKDLKPVVFHDGNTVSCRNNLTVRQKASSNGGNKTGILS